VVAAQNHGRQLRTQDGLSGNAMGPWKAMETSWWYYWIHNGIRSV
jgi:hypothetical protein